MNRKAVIFAVLLLLLLAPAASAWSWNPATWISRAFKIGDGKDIDLNGRGIGNGSASNITCGGNCTGFGASGGIETNASNLTKGTILTSILDNSSVEYTSRKGAISGYTGLTALKDILLYTNTINENRLYFQNATSGNQIAYFTATGAVNSETLYLRDDAGNYNRVWTDSYNNDSNGTGGNGSYSMYIYNKSGTYFAVNDEGTIIYSSTVGWDVFNNSLNHSYKRIYLKTGTNIIDIPLSENNIGEHAGGNITIIGEDWNILSVVSPTTNFLGLSAGSRLEHVKIQDAFADDPTAPAGTARKIESAINSRRSSSAAISNWDSQAYTTLQGEPGVDSPGWSMINYGSGDSIYIQLQGVGGTYNTGTGIRIDDYRPESSRGGTGSSSAPIVIYDYNNTLSNGARNYVLIANTSHEFLNISSTRTVFSAPDGSQATGALFEQARNGNAAEDTGWIAAAFGGKNSLGDRVVLGSDTRGAVVGATNNALSGWSKLLLRASSGDDGITIATTGNVGVGNITPINILAFAVGSGTDPIADSWLQYSTPESKIVIGEADNLTEKYRADFRNTTVYKWKRTINEPERLGVLAEKGKAPQEILAYHDGKNNTNSTTPNAIPQGIDLGAYIGWLHEVVKGQDIQLQEQQKQIDYLYTQLNITKPN